MATRDELVAAVIERYSKGRRAEKGRILDEFVAVTGFHRKHAMRVLRGGQASRRSAPRPERRLYDEAVREALIVIWEASDWVCGKRLKALAPILVDAMERHGRLHLAPEVRARLLAISAATIDRALRAVRAQAGGGTRRRTAASSAVRRSVLSEILTELRKLLPFDLLGFDTDNDSVFMNETVRDYCQAVDFISRQMRWEDLNVVI